MGALADVYFSSRKTQHAYRQVLWRMTVEDAQAVCSHPDTCHPGSWMMCWTAHELVDAKPVCFIEDDGRFDALFEELGVTVLMSKAMLLNGTAEVTSPATKPAQVPARMRTNREREQLSLFSHMEAG